MLADLVAWLREQIDEDERVAQDARGHVWRYDPERSTALVVDAGSGQAIAYRPRSGDAPSAGDGIHIARWDPARVLAEVAAKRAILDHCVSTIRHAGDPPGIDPEDVTAVEHVIHLLAQPFAGRAGFDPSWLD